MAAAFWLASWFGIAALVLGGAGLFYTDIDAGEVPRLGALIALGLWSAAAALLSRLDSTIPPRALAGMRGLIVGGALVTFVSLAMEREAWPLVAALLQIALLAGIAWTSLQAGYREGFRLGTAAVCLRLLMVYIEVFGSLLETGLGLIIGGALAMLLCWWWVRRSDQLERALGPVATSTGEGALDE